MPISPKIKSTLLLPIVLAGCGKSAVIDPRTSTPLVATATVGGADDATRTFTGVVASRVHGDLGFRVGGRITQRLVDVGQQVRRGEALMRIDGTDLNLAAIGEQGNVAAAQARYGQAVGDVNRMSGLVEAGAVSAQMYDAARATAAGARAQLSAAQAGARVARNQGSYAVLVAPADGVITEAMAEPGQVVAAGQIVIRLAQGGEREAQVNLPENIRPAIGSLAQAELAIGNGSRSAARLRQLSAAADAQTRTFDARYILTGAAANAPLGSTVTLRLPGTSGVGNQSIPLGALHDAGKGPGVWLIQPKTRKIKFRRVRVVRIGAEEAIISAGVAAGDRIVSLGAHLLHEGQKVRILKQELAR